MSARLLMAFSHFVERRLNGGKVGEGFFRMPGPNLHHRRSIQRWIERVHCSKDSRGRLSHTSMISNGELADFAGAISFYRGKVGAGNAGIIDHADLHRVGSKAGELAIFPGLDVTAADAEAGIDAQRAFLPCGSVDDFCPDTNLLQLVHKFERYEFSHRAGRMHLPHV